jgi:methionyl-tRNA formyltransferase
MGKGMLVVGCGEEALRLLEVQREGGRRLGVEQFLAGYPLQPGQRLGKA